MKFLATIDQEGGGQFLNLKIQMVASLPLAGTFVGQQVFLTPAARIFMWDGTIWRQIPPSNRLSFGPTTGASVDPFTPIITFGAGKILQPGGDIYIENLDVANALTYQIQGVDALLGGSPVNLPADESGTPAQASVAFGATARYGISAKVPLFQSIVLNLKSTVPGSPANYRVRSQAVVFD